MLRALLVLYLIEEKIFAAFANADECFGHEGQPLSRHAFEKAAFANADECFGHEKKWTKL